MPKLKLQYLGHLMQRTDSLEKTLMLGKINVGREGDYREWDGWMASPTWWTWVWVNPGSWCWTGRPGELQSMGSWRVWHDWVAKLNWTELNSPIPVHFSSLIPKMLMFTLAISSFSSVTQSCLTLYDPMNRSTPGLPVHHQLLQFTQTHAHRVGDAIQPSHPLLSPSPPAPNPSQHQGLFQWVSSSHEVAKVLEFQLQHQSCQWTKSRTQLSDWMELN